MQKESVKNGGQRRQEEDAGSHIGNNEGSQQVERHYFETSYQAWNHKCKNNDDTNDDDIS